MEVRCKASVTTLDGEKSRDDKPVHSRTLCLMALRRTNHSWSARHRRGVHYSGQPVAISLPLWQDAISLRDGGLSLMAFFVAFGDPLSSSIHCGLVRYLGAGFLIRCIAGLPIGLLPGSLVCCGTRLAFLWGVIAVLLVWISEGTWQRAS